MISHKANLLLKTYFYRFMMLRTLKTFVQPKIPLPDDRRYDYDTKMWATLKSLSFRRAPVLVGDPLIPRLAHSRPRQEIFEKWSKAARYEHFRWFRIGK